MWSPFSAKKSTGDADSGSTSPSASCLALLPIPAFTCSAHAPGVQLELVNDAARALLPDALDPVGIAAERLFIPADRDLFHAMFQKGDSLPLRCRKSDGRSMIVRPQIAAIGNNARLILLLPDEAGSDLWQQLQQRDQELQQFSLIQATTHDFRNVLTSLIGTAELMQFDAPPEMDATLIEQMIASGESGERLLTAFISFGQRFVGEEYPIADNERIELESLLSQMRVRMPESLRLDWQLPETLPLPHGMRLSLHLILLNLLRHAARQLDRPGNILLSLDRESGEVRLRVESDAAPFSDGLIDHLFKPYKAPQPEGAAMGMELAIARRLAQRFGGNLEIVPHPQKQILALQLPLRE